MDEFIHSLTEGYLTCTAAEKEERIRKMEPTRNQFLSNDVLWLGRQQVEFDNAVRDLPTGSVKAVARAFGLACGSGRKASEALRGWREALEARHGATAVSDAYVDTRRVV